MAEKRVSKEVKNKKETTKKEEKTMKKDFKTKKEEKSVKKEKASKEKSMKKDFEKVDAFKSLSFVLMTEKAIQLIETQNKLAFVVRRSATKSDIKKAIEHVFQTPVSKVNTVVDQDGRKKAFVRFAKQGEAGEIAIRLGII